jgi:hypothetical protein
MFAEKLDTLAKKVEGRARRRRHGKESVDNFLPVIGELPQKQRRKNSAV